MKPNIGDTIYCIYISGFDRWIKKEKVKFLGERSFIVKCEELNPNAEQHYCEENVRWFYSLEEAKRHIIEDYGDLAKKYRFVFDIRRKDEEVYYFIRNKQNEPTHKELFNHFIANRAELYRQEIEEIYDITLLSSKEQEWLK